MKTKVLLPTYVSAANQWCCTQFDGYTKGKGGVLKPIQKQVWFSTHSEAIKFYKDSKLNLST